MGNTRLEFVYVRLHLAKRDIRITVFQNIIILANHAVCLQMLGTLPCLPMYTMAFIISTQFSMKCL